MAEPTTLYNRLGESITVYAPSEVTRLTRVGWAASVERARADALAGEAPPALAPDADVTTIPETGVTIVTEAADEPPAQEEVVVFEDAGVTVVTAASSAPGEYSAPAGKVKATVTQQMDAPAADANKAEKRARR